MLLRPPSINEGAEDNLSHVNTESDARQSSRSRNKIKKKQNSLSLRNKPLNSSRENEQGDKQLIVEKEREADNGSVHSYASGKSKQKKKQSSIGVKKNRGTMLAANSPRKSEQDQLQVLDYATNRQEETRKQYQIEHSEVKQHFATNNYSPNAYERQYPRQPQDKKYNSFNNIISEAQFDTRPKLRDEIDEEIPVVKLVEERKNREPNFRTHPYNVVSPRIAQKKQTKKLGQLFEENRRNIQNNSQLGVSASQINGSSVLGGQSRRSRSKLGQLFKDKSKQKQMSNTSQLSYTHNASSNFNESINNSNLNRNFGNDPSGNRNADIHVLGGGSRSREKQQIKRALIPEKVLQQSVHQFQTGDDVHNQSELNLSLSKNSPFVSKLEANQANNKDSLCFNIEPEKKKKGLGVTSKNSKIQDEIIKISGNLVSKDLGPPRNQHVNPFMGLQSEKPRQTDSHERLKNNFKENQKYLMQSGVNMSSFDNQNQQNQQTRRKQQALKNRQLQLEQERQLMAEKNRLEQTCLDRQRQTQRKKQEQLRQQREFLTRQQEKRRAQVQRQEQQRKKDEQRKERDRIKQEQTKVRFKREQLQFEQKKQAEAQRQRQKQLQLQRQSQRQKQEEQRLKQQRENRKKMDRQKQQHERQQKLQLQAERKRQQQRAFEERQAQEEKARLKKNYEKQRQKSGHSLYQANQKQGSLIYELQNDSIVSPGQQPKVSLDKLPSSYSRDHSSRGSQRSQQSRKSSRKKEGVIARNNNRHILGEASPRAEESFYQQTQAQKPNARKQSNNNQGEGPRKLMSFSQEDLAYEAKPQSKTDSYFYDKSSKAYSKPPLSKKSSSKSKPKESFINKKSSKDSQIKTSFTGGQSKPADKKLSLVELAMKKNYEPESGSQCHSQDSFRSRQNSSASRNSRNSGYSKESKGSKKKESVIPLKQNSINGYNRPPLYRKASSENEDSLANHRSRYQQQMQRATNERSHFQDIMDKQGKPIVVKGCSFIDERGRLVDGNMVVRGSQVTGISNRNQTGLTQKKFIQRLMNSRERRRSISRERSLKGSRASDRSRSRERESTNGFNQEKYIQSEAYSESEDKRNSGSNFYGTRNEQSFYQNYTGSKTNFGGTGNLRSGTPQTLQQFVRPIQQAGIAQRIQQQNNQHQGVRRDTGSTNQKRKMQRTQRGKY